MATSLIYYHPSVLEHLPASDLPGMYELSRFRMLFGDTGTKSHVLIDRSNTIRTPMRTTSLFPIPTFRPITKTYEEICNERAQDLLQRAERSNMPLCVFWSGGIDSTLVLISLLKQATPEQKDAIVVCMTEHSILENPNFYRDHIRGELRVDSSAMASYLVGTRVIITNGDLNDPVFGMGAVGRVMRAFGQDIIHKPYQRDKLFLFFNKGVADDRVTNLYLDLFEILVRNAPVPIKTYLDYLWWLNFTLKWQFSSMKLVTAASRMAASNITREYMEAQFLPFFGTEDFQLWSMNNMDKKLKDEYRTFKWICKDIIYDYTKDAEYRDNKIKTGSLRHIFSGGRAFKYIDDSMHFYERLDPSEYYEPDNDFV